MFGGFQVAGLGRLRSQPGTDPAARERQRETA